jgi:hypothetical protein
MRTWERLLYWLITGTLVGFGFAAAASIGLPFLLIGTIMLFYGILRVGPRDFWGALVGFGMLPAFLILYGDRLYGHCPINGWQTWKLPTLIPDTLGGTDVPCGAIPQSSLYWTAFFIVIALAGVVWGLIAAVRKSDSRLIA